MYDKTLIKDEFGQHYTIQTHVSPQIRGSLSPKEFSDHQSASRFVQSLQVPPGYWQMLMHDMGGIHGGAMANETDMVAERMVSGPLKVFEIEPPNPSSASPKKRAIQTRDKVYHFVPSVEQLLNKTETKNFNSVDDARAFLQELNPDQEQLKGMASELNITVPATASANPAVLSEAIAESLATGDAVVMVDQIASATTPTVAEAVAAAVVQEAGLGPEEEKKIEEKKEEQPCTLSKYTVKCSHGREVTLDPTKQKEGVVPRLELVSVSSNANKDQQETITVDLDLETPCSSHEKEQIKIGKDLASYVGETFGQSVEIRTPSEPLNIKDQHFRYVWLPSVKPIKYQVNPSMGFCHTEKFDGKGKGVPVYVYPEMKWEWKTTINFGKLEFIPGKSEFKYSDFKIGDDSNVVLTYDGEPYDAKEKYEEYIKKPMEGFKKICDAISKVLEVINDPASLMRLGTETTNDPPKKGEDNKDGNDSKLQVTWPNLAIQYESTLKEDDNPAFVNHEYSISVQADPLLNVDIKIDIIDTLRRFAKIPGSAKKILEIAIEKIQKRMGVDEDSEFKGELDLIFKVSCNVKLTEGSLKGSHNVEKHDLSGDPIKTDIDIPVELKGVAKAKGRVFIISFDIDYEIKGEAGWKGWAEIGKDDQGVYFQQLIEFTGITVTLTKYVEVSAEVTDDEEETEGWGLKTDSGEVKVDEEGNVSGKVTKKEESKSEWKWLEKIAGEDAKEPDKYYLVGK